MRKKVVFKAGKFQIQPETRMDLNPTCCNLKLSLLRDERKAS